MTQEVERYELCAHLTSNHVREINSEEYEQLLHHKRMLVFLQHFEGLYEIVKENFRDFWRTMFDISENHRLHLTMERFSSIKEISRLNLRISNILNSYKSYEDHLSKRLSNIFDSNHEYRDYFDTTKSWWYDNLFDYRFCVRLRNYTQHLSTPIDMLSYPSHLLRREPQEIAYTISPIVYKRNLLEYDGWSKVRDEISSLQDEVDLAPIFQSFFNAVVDIHSKMRYRMEQVYRDSKSFIENLHSECAEFLRKKQMPDNPMPTVVLQNTDKTIATEWIPYDIIKVVENFRSQNANSGSNGYAFTTMQASKDIKEIQDILLDKET